MIGSRDGVAIFTLEAFDVCVFELKEVFSFLAMRLVVEDAPFFSEALGVCVSGRGPSTDTPSSFALLILRDGFGFRSSLTDELDSLLIRPILGRGGR